jgi:hypothetical protein
MNTTEYTTIPDGGRITLPTATDRDAPAAATYEVPVDFVDLACHLREAAEAADDWMAAMLLDIEKNVGRPNMRWPATLCSCRLSAGG